jgi:tetratricopeptide (TPR) repeat protein
MTLSGANTARLALLVLFGAVAAPAWSAPEYTFCGQPFSANAFGRPLDYNDPAERERIGGIEYNHLNRDVELLIRGVSGPYAVDDLAYVLRQVPNHYRALAVMSDFQLKKGYRGDYAVNNIYTADCYFQRALTLHGADPVIHLIYAIHLHRSQKLDAALVEYETAQQIGPPNAELHYNLGLLYVDLKRYDDAREQAKQAYAMGYPLNGLRARLNRLGEWNPN